MSKEFKTQDYFRYKRLGKKWRRPVGWQSKLRLKKGGAGRKVSIGYGTPKEGVLDEVIVVRNVADVVLAGGRPIRIAGPVGARKVLEIQKKAKEMDSRIVNAKKAKRAEKMVKSIADRKVAKKKKEEEKKKQEEKAKKENKGKKDEVKTETKAEEKKEEKPEAGSRDGKAKPGEEGIDKNFNPEFRT